MLRANSLATLITLAFVTAAQGGTWIRVNQLGYLPVSTKVAVLGTSDSSLHVGAFALHDALTRQQIRGAGEFLRTRRHVAVDWPATPFDPFFNINTPAELALAEARLVSGEGDSV